MSALYFSAIIRLTAIIAHLYFSPCIEALSDAPEVLGFRLLPPPCLHCVGENFTHNGNQDQFSNQLNNSFIDLLIYWHEEPKVVR